MDIITGTEYDLKSMIRDVSLQYLRVNDPLEKAVLFSMLDNLCRVYNSVNQGRRKLSVSRAIKKDSEQYVELLDTYNNKFDSNFIDFKDFHSTYLGDILDVENDELFVLSKIEEGFCSGGFSKDDFSLVFFDFLKTMNLEYLLDDLIKERRIFSKIRTVRPRRFDFKGLTLHNPVYGDMAVVIDDCQYMLKDMAVLAHEFGHVYDLLKLEKDGLCQNVTNYAYSSVFGEVISTMFEKRLYEYLIKNNIMAERAKDYYNSSLFDGKDHVFGGYVLSLLDDYYLREDEYCSLTEKELFNLVSENFEDAVLLRTMLGYKNFSLYGDLFYGYGEILSMFLKEEIEKEGFEGKVMRDFMHCRTEAFNPLFLEKNDLDVKRYRKLYKQDVELCKK